jgi:hypothetical protein
MSSHFIGGSKYTIRWSKTLLPLNTSPPSRDHFSFPFFNVSPLFHNFSTFSHRQSMWAGGGGCYYFKCLNIEILTDALRYYSIFC